MRAGLVKAHIRRFLGDSRRPPAIPTGQTNIAAPRRERKERPSWACPRIYHRADLAWSDEGVTDAQLAELNLIPSDRRLRLTMELARQLMGAPRHLS